VIVPSLLIVTLALCVVFVWRAGRRFPGLSVIAAAVAAVVAVLLLRNPVFAAAGLLVALAVIYLPSRPKR
jgi:hypothetical protein